MHRRWRQAFAGIAWLFVGGVVAQVFLAGLGLFEVTDMTLHAAFGYLLPYLTIGLLVVAWPARVGRRTAWLCVAIFVLGGVVQPTLPAFRGDLPLIAALHPPNALIVFWLGLIVARRSVVLLRGERLTSGRG